MSAHHLALRFLPIAPITKHRMVERHDWAAERLTQLEKTSWRQLRGRRSDEWLAGRLAAKDAVIALHGAASTGAAFWPEITTSVSDSDHGRPLTCAPYHISISLSHGLAVAAASTRPVGVDIEAHERRWPLNVLELITHVTERLPRPVRLLPAMAWSCAEAVLKQRGCGIRQGIDVVHLTRFTDEGVFEWTEHPPREGRGVDAPLCGFAKNLGSHSLALVWEQEPIKQHNDERAKS